jgi:phage gpG-like protein
MPVALDFDWHPSVTVIRADFFTLAGALENQSEALQTAVEHVMAPSIRTNFDVGGRPPWSPLMDSTIEHSQRQSAEGTLVVTGNLRDTASSVSVWRVDKSEAALDSSRLGGAFYGLFHQVGYGSTPARPWAVMQNEDADRIEEIFGGWISSRAAATGWVSSVIGAVSGFFSRRGR